MLIVHRPQFNHNRYIHTGGGIGSIFGKLLTRATSKVVNTGLKSAIAAGSKIAKQGINKIATGKRVSSILKGTLKKGLRAGKSYTQKQLKSLPKKALNYAIEKSKDPKTQQFIQKAITKGAKQVIETLSPKSNNLNHQPNTSPSFLKQAATETIKSLLTPTPASYNPETESRTTTNLKDNRKRKRLSYPIKKTKSTTTKKKRKLNFSNKYNSNINSLIARS